MTEDRKGRPSSEPAQGVDPLSVGELIPLAQAAQAAGLTPGSLREYARQGRLAARKVGRDWLTTAEAVRAYLESRDLEKVPRRYRNRT